jgi:coenzyme F420-reducing hydrogenase delta subunit
MSEEYVKVEGSSELYKNLYTGVVINRNEQEIKIARERKKAIKLESERSEKMANEVSDLRSEISELKALIKAMAER